MSNKLKKLPKLLFVILAFVFLLNFYLATRDSQTIDEGAHLAAGYSYVTTGDFRLNPEHPALFKLLAGVAILPLDTRPAEQLKGWNEANQWPAGKDLIYNSRSSARQILLLARLPSIFITVTLVYAVFLLARRLGGEKVGLLAAGLFALDPTLNGHGHLVTNDIFLGLGGVLFLLAALNYFNKPDRKHLLLLATSILLTVNTKFSGLVFIPIGLVLIAVKKRWKIKSIIKNSIVVFGVLALGTWALYGFQLMSVNDELRISPADDRFAEQTQALNSRLPSAGRLYNLEIPAYSYFRGLITLKTHNLDGHLTYFFGDRNRHGNLLYFPVALATKLPPIIIGANLVAGLALLLRRKKLTASTHRTLLLSSAFIALFVGVGMASQINIGVRHIFGAWPFIYLIAATMLLKIFEKSGRRRVIFLGLLVALYIPVLVGTVRTPISYQNEFGNAIEGLANRPILIDSNRDWAQDLYRLNDYLEAEDINRFGEGLFNNTTMSDVFSGRTICAIEYYTPGCTDYSELPCTLAISDTALWLDASEFYKWAVNSYDLVDRVGGSIGIYHCRD